MDGVEQPEIVQSVIVQVAYSGKSRVIDAIGAHQPQPEDAIELKVLDVAAQCLRRESFSALIFVASAGAALAQSNHPRQGTQL